MYETFVYLAESCMGTCYCMACHKKLGVKKRLLILVIAVMLWTNWMLRHMSITVYMSNLHMVLTLNTLAKHQIQVSVIPENITSGIQQSGEGLGLLVFNINMLDLHVCSTGRISSLFLRLYQLNIRCLYLSFGLTQKHFVSLPLTPTPIPFPHHSSRQLETTSLSISYATSDSITHKVDRIPDITRYH